jgi:hypothetical protein
MGDDKKAERKGIDNNESKEKVKARKAELTVLIVVEGGIVFMEIFYDHKLDGQMALF